MFAPRVPWKAFWGDRLLSCVGSLRRSCDHNNIVPLGSDFNIAGALKAVSAGMVLKVADALMAGVPQTLEPLLMLKLFP